MAKAKKVIRKRALAATQQQLVDIDKPHYSIKQFNEHLDQFTKQSVDVMQRTADEVHHRTLVNSFLTIAHALPAECTVTLITADTVRALASELRSNG